MCSWISARHRPRAHLRVVAVLGDPARARIVERDRARPSASSCVSDFHDELVDDALDGDRVERGELDDRIEAVAELGREQAADRLPCRRWCCRHCVKPIEARAMSCAPGVGGHDDDHVAEVGLAAVVVGERAVVHHLQQQVEHIRMRLLDLIEQQHAVRMLGDRLGQQAALVEADVARRRADQRATPCGAPCTPTCRSAGTRRPWRAPAGA